MGLSLDISPEFDQQGDYDTEMIGEFGGEETSGAEHLRAREDETSSNNSVLEFVMLATLSSPAGSYPTSPRKLKGKQKI